MACHHWRRKQEREGVLGGWQRWWSIQQLVDVSIAWTAEAAAHIWCPWSKVGCLKADHARDKLKWWRISKSLNILEKAYVNGPQLGDMWTINNFHLGLKLCEATSHMAGQREWEIFCGAVSFSPFFTLHSRNTRAPLQMRHLQAATLKVHRGERLVDLWFGFTISDS